MYLWAELFMSQAFELKLVCGAMATEFQFNQQIQIRRKLKTFMLSDVSPSSSKTLLIKFA